MFVSKNDHQYKRAMLCNLVHMIPCNIGDQGSWFDEIMGFMKVNFGVHGTHGNLAKFCSMVNETFISIYML